MVGRERRGSVAGDPSHPDHRPARGYRYEPFPVKHGARSPQTVQPIADRLAAELVEVAPWCAAPAFAHTLASWAWSEAQALLLRAWLDEHGLVDDDGRPTSGTYELGRVEGRLIKLRAELGLSPQSLGALLSKAASVARATADDRVLAELQAEGQRILDARVQHERSLGRGDDG